MEYEYKKLSELGRVVTGKTPPTENSEYYDGDYPFITPSDIESFDEKYLLATERSLSDLGAQELGSLVLPPQSICFVSIGSTIGKMCKTHKRSYTNQQINTLVPNENYDSDYLFYFLRYIKSYFQSIGGGTGSGKGIVNKTVFSKTKVNVLKDKTCQHKMASVLSAYDNLIEVNNKRIKVLEQMAENLYKEWFVRFRFPGHETAEFENGIPKGWEYAKLFDIAKVTYGYAFSSDEFCEDESLNAVVRIRDVPNNATKTYTAEPCDNKYLISENAILVGMDGIFHMCLWNGRKAYLNQRVVEIESTCKSFCNYLLYLSIAPQIKFWEQVIAGTTVAHLGDKHLKRINVLVPDEDALRKMNPAFETIMNEKNLLFKENERLISQRDLLLPRLMSGKLEV